MEIIKGQDIYEVHIVPPPICQLSPGISASPSLLRGAALKAFANSRSAKPRANSLLKSTSDPLDKPQEYRYI